MLNNSGGEGIRTPGTLADTAVFKTAAFDHSATPPGEAALPCALSLRRGQGV